MEKFINPLENIRIASPCSADWNEMIGNERQRFCGACKLNVYNLSGMSKREAENLILQSEGRLCVRFYRRADGTVLTKDCPVGWQAIKRNVSKTATAFASLVFTALSGIGLVNYFAKSDKQQIIGTMPVIENSKIEYPITREIAIDESNSNIAIRQKPIEVIGANITAPEYTLSNGGIGNFEEVRGQIKKQRRR
ncbi:MAG: hypothetical protein M3033_16845 [Acidobacteriota bacterium]|nr:hypothetical protein [Acidobacteriota bacterium]